MGTLSSLVSGAYLRGDAVVGCGPNIKYMTRLERVARDKRFIIFGLVSSNKEQSLVALTSGANPIKPLAVVIY
jgi:hypothetical protein